MYKNIGFQICMPTFNQLYELKENTSMKIVKSYNDINGLNGAILKSKYNGNQIFFPFSGHMIIQIITLIKDIIGQVIQEIMMTRKLHIV